MKETQLSDSSVELRQWAFDRAITLHKDMDIVSDVIFMASEIEAYITKGRNPRHEFFTCVDAALAEVDNADIPHVGADKKTKVIALVRHWLKEYNALD